MGAFSNIRDRLTKGRLQHVVFRIPGKCYGDMCFPFRGTFSTQELYAHAARHGVLTGLVKSGYLARQRHVHSGKIEIRHLY